MSELKAKEIPIYGTKVDYGMDVRTLKEKDKKISKKGLTKQNTCGMINRRLKKPP